MSRTPSSAAKLSLTVFTGASTRICEGWTGSSKEMHGSVGSGTWLSGAGSVQESQSAGVDAVVLLREALRRCDGARHVGGRRTGEVERVHAGQGRGVRGGLRLAAHHPGLAEVDDQRGDREEHDGHEGDQQHDRPGVVGTPLLEAGDEASHEHHDQLDPVGSSSAPPVST